MIWFILLTLVAGVGLYLMQPFMMSADQRPVETLKEARAQRAGIDLDHAEGRLTEHAAHEAREAIDRRILALIDGPEMDPANRDLRSIAFYVVPAILVLGCVGVYTLVGQPGYQPITEAEFQAEQIAQLPQSLDGLVVELKQRLDADPNPPADGYVLLARSYLRLERIEEALAAYGTAIEISDGQAAIITERDRVVALLQERLSQPQIDPDAAERIRSMTPEDQAVMIANMVDGLAVRLEQDPDDAQGWQRLIRARMVLGQTNQANLDLASAQAHFEDEPEVLAQFAPFEAELSAAAD